MQYSFSQAPMSDLCCLPSLVFAGFSRACLTTYCVCSCFSMALPCSLLPPCFLSLLMALLPSSQPCPPPPTESTLPAKLQSKKRIFDINPNKFLLHFFSRQQGVSEGCGNICPQACDFKSKGSSHMKNDLGLKAELPVNLPGLMLCDKAQQCLFKRMHCFNSSECFSCLIRKSHCDVMISDQTEVPGRG